MLWSLIPGFIATAAKACGLGFSLRLPFRSWLAVKIWLLLAVLQDLALYAVLWLGFDPRTSILYAQVYYWSDLIVELVGLLVLFRLAEVALAKTKVDVPLMRTICLSLLGAIAIISSATVLSRLGPAALSLKHLTAFASEAEQNLAAAGMVASFVLWGAISMLRVPGARIRRIAAAYGICYSQGACAWSLVALFGRGAHIIVELFATGSMVLLAYAMAERDEGTPARPKRQPAEVADAPLLAAEQRGVA